MFDRIICSFQNRPGRPRDQQEYRRQTNCHPDGHSFFIPSFGWVVEGSFFPPAAPPFAPSPDCLKEKAEHSTNSGPSSGKPWPAVVRCSCRSGRKFALDDAGREMLLGNFSRWPSRLSLLHDDLTSSSAGVHPHWPCHFARFSLSNSLHYPVTVGGKLEILLV